MELNGNTSENSTVVIYGDNASPAFAVISMILSIWIIVANSFVVVCFISHRTVLTKSTFTFQILTLSVNDLIAGVSTLPVYITIFKEDTSYSLCVFRFLLFLSAQVIVLFHLLGICMYRLFIVFHVNAPLLETRKRGRTVAYLITCWVVILSFLILPFLIWGKYRHKITICSLNEMLQDNYKVFISYYIIFCIVPFLLTNGLYVVIILKLCFSKQRINPVNSYNSDPVRSSSQTGLKKHRECQPTETFVKGQSLHSQISKEEFFGRPNLSHQPSSSNAHDIVEIFQLSSEYSGADSQGKSTTVTFMKEDQQGSNNSRMTLSQDNTDQRDSRTNKQYYHSKRLNIKGVQKDGRESRDKRVESNGEQQIIQPQNIASFKSQRVALITTGKLHWLQSLGTKCVDTVEPQ